jgi:hypothetical protein
MPRFDIIVHFCVPNETHDLDDTSVCVSASNSTIKNDSLGSILGSEWMDADDHSLSLPGDGKLAEPLDELHDLDDCSRGFLHRYSPMLM